MTDADNIVNLPHFAQVCARRRRNSSLWLNQEFSYYPFLIFRSLIIIGKELYSQFDYVRKISQWNTVSIFINTNIGIAFFTFYTIE